MPTTISSSPCQDAGAAAWSAPRFTATGAAIAGTRPVTEPGLTGRPV